MTAQVQVMMSLSRPKRMHFLGSDGHRYRFLAKPNDDLRRDMRVMEYATLLNRLVADDAATCRRGTRVRALRTSLLNRLVTTLRFLSCDTVGAGVAAAGGERGACGVQVQTFMCLPLADSGGVVEWVLNTQTYHSILRETYANVNRPAATSHSRGEWDAAKARMGKPPKDPQALAKWFRAKLDVAPPVMHEWWLATCAPPAQTRLRLWKFSCFCSSQHCSSVRRASCADEVSLSTRRCGGAGSRTRPCGWRRATRLRARAPSGPWPATS